MFWTPLIALLVAGSGPAASPTAADLLNCVGDNADRLALRSDRPEVLAGQAFAGCEDLFEGVAAGRDSSAAAAGEDPERGKADSAVWRTNVRKAMLDAAVRVIEKRRSRR